MKQKVEELENAVNEQTSPDEQLKLLSLAVDQSSEGIAMSDLDGNLQYLNNAFAEMHGYSAKELVGKNLSIFMLLNKRHPWKQPIWSSSKQMTSKVKFGIPDLMLLFSYAVIIPNLDGPRIPIRRNCLWNVPVVEKVLTK